MKIIITGALGHIGSKLIRSLDDYSNLLLIDNMSANRYCSLFNLVTPNYKFIEEDLREPALNLKQYVNEGDIVVHLAAKTDAEKSVEWDKKDNHNFMITSDIALTCLQKKANMIHLSSTSIYGSQESVVDEDCKELKPQSPYATSKFNEETILKKMKSFVPSFKYVTLRLGTICGISPGMRFHTAVNKFCWQASMGQRITVWETALHQMRPYLSLGDAIRAIRFVISNKLFDGEIYNVVTNNFTVNDILEQIKKYSDINIRFVNSTIMNQLSYTVLADKIKEKGFIPTGDIALDIKETMGILKCS